MHYSFSISHSNGRPIYYSSGAAAAADPTKEIPTKTYGKEIIDTIHVEDENIVLNETTVESVKTNCNLKMNGAHVPRIDVEGVVDAADCTLRKIKSGPLTLGNSTFKFVSANGTSSVNNCNSSGRLKVNGNLTLTNCSNLKATANGSINATNCTNLGKLVINGSATLAGTSARSLKVNGNATVNNSELDKLIICGELSVSGSKVNKLTVNAPVHVSFLNNGTVVHRKQVVTVYLNNTEVGDIDFGTDEGRVVLRGTSKVTGTIKNGSIISSSAAAAR